MDRVVVENLVKEFTRVKREPGFMNSVRSFIKPKRESFLAVNQVSLRVGEAETVGFLGPNGAGKTTTLKILSGILHKTKGTAEVLGYDPFRRQPDFLKQIALVMGNKQQLWWDLPAVDSFEVLKELYDIPPKRYKYKLDALLPMLDLTDKVNVQVRRMSLGERMKCELVASLLHDPKVVFLDEPTLGLDLTSQSRIRAFLKGYQKESGCSILLTSHYMQDVEELCERVVVINLGQVVYDGSMAALAERHSSERRLRLTLGSEEDRVRLERSFDLKESDGNIAVISVPKTEIARVTGQVLGDFEVADITVEEPSVEEVISALFQESSESVSRETSGR